MQAQALRIDAEVLVFEILLAQAEILARLARIFSDPELQRRLLRTAQRASDLAGTPQQGVDLSRELRVDWICIEDRRDLDSNFACMH